jgi:hypothetical protein
VLEELLANEKKQSKASLRGILTQFEQFKKTHANIGANFEEFLQNVSLDQDLEDMSPLLMCFKLKAKLTELESR